jgi:hypothetical protein
MPPNRSVTTRNRATVTPKRPGTLMVVPYLPVEPNVWEQWTPEGCVAIAARFLDHDGVDLGGAHADDHQWCEQLARTTAARGLLLAQVAHVHGPNGLHMVWRLAGGLLDDVTQGLIEAALGILVEPVSGNPLLPPGDTPRQ